MNNNDQTSTFDALPPPYIPLPSPSPTPKTQKRKEVRFSLPSTDLEASPSSLDPALTSDPFLDVADSRIRHFRASMESNHTINEAANDTATPAAAAPSYPTSLIHHPRTAMDGDAEIPYPFRFFRPTSLPTPDAPAHDDDPPHESFSDIVLQIMLIPPLQLALASLMQAVLEFRRTPGPTAASDDWLEYTLRLFFVVQDGVIWGMGHMWMGWQERGGGFLATEAGRKRMGVMRVVVFLWILVGFTLLVVAS